MGKILFFIFIPCLTWAITITNFVEIEIVRDVVNYSNVITTISNIVDVYQTNFTFITNVVDITNTVNVETVIQKNADMRHIAGISFLYQMNQGTGFGVSYGYQIIENFPFYLGAQIGATKDPVVGLFGMMKF